MDDKTTFINGGLSGFHGTIYFCIIAAAALFLHQETSTMIVSLGFLRRAQSLLCRHEREIRIQSRANFRFKISLSYSLSSVILDCIYAHKLCNLQLRLCISVKAVNICQMHVIYYTRVDRLQNS